MIDYSIISLVIIALLFFLLWLLESASARLWRSHAEHLAAELRQRAAVVESLAERCCRQSELLAARAMREPQEAAEDQWDCGHEEED